MLGEQNRTLLFAIGHAVAFVYEPVYTQVLTFVGLPPEGYSTQENSARSLTITGVRERKWQENPIT